MLPCVCLRKMRAFGQPFEKVSHRPTEVSSLKKKKWTLAWSRCCAHKKCAFAGRQLPAPVHDRQFGSVVFFTFSPLSPARFFGPLHVNQLIVNDAGATAASAAIGPKSQIRRRTTHSA